MYVNVVWEFVENIMYLICYLHILYGGGRVVMVVIVWLLDFWILQSVPITEVVSSNDSEIRLGNG
jgi:hypothetical protein